MTAIVPVSALRGDNVTQPLDAPWYDGPSLLQGLEGLPALQEKVEGQLLIPVQYVAREGEGTGHQPRTLWGRIAHGQVKAGDQIDARLRELSAVAPAVFADFEIAALADGTEVATSPLATEV